MYHILSAAPGLQRPVEKDGLLKTPGLRIASKSRNSKNCKGIYFLKLPSFAGETVCKEKWKKRVMCLKQLNTITTTNTSSHLIKSTR